MQGLIGFSISTRAGTYAESNKAMFGKSLAIADYSSLESLNLYKMCKLSFYTYN